MAFRLASKSCFSYTLSDLDSKYLNHQPAMPHTFVPHFSRINAIVAGSLFAILLSSCAGAKPQVTALPDFNAATAQLSLRSTGNEAMVVSAHATATAVGEWILHEGGNTVDATIATLAALNVVEPQASGIGGGGYALYYDAQQDSFYALDFRERAPGFIDIPTYFKSEDSNRVAQRWGVTSALVPGCAAGWHEFYSRFGSLPLSKILAPAVTLAETGFPLTEYQYHSVEGKLEYMANDPAISEVFLNGEHPRAVGDTIRQSNLAKLYRHLAETGLDAFYSAPVSTDLISFVQAGGSTISQQDMDEYQVIYRKPLRGFYRGYEIVTIGPPSGGGVGLREALELLKGYDIGSMERLGIEYTQTLASAIRIARENYRYWIADPDYYNVPVESILSPERAIETRKLIFPDSVAKNVSPMTEQQILDSEKGNTTHLVVADKSGNLMCLTQSINYYFGASVMDPQWGYILNNLMADFDHDTVGINTIHPYHRPASTMACTIIKKDGKPLVVIGTPGGTRIASTMTQVIVGMLDYNLTLEEALDAPRFYTAGRRLEIENRFAEDVMNKLSEFGWKVDPKDAFDAYFGGVNAIYIDPATHKLIGCSDPRRDGASAGF